MSDYIFHDPEVTSKILGMMQLAADKSLQFEAYSTGEGFKVTGGGRKTSFYLSLAVLKNLTVHQLLTLMGVPVRE